MLKVGIPDQKVKIKRTRDDNLVRKRYSYAFYAFVMPVKLFSKLQPIFPHIVQPHPGVIWSRYEQIQGLYNVYACKIGLHTHHLAVRHEGLVYFVGWVL